jgi:hypothetical protein
MLRAQLTKAPRAQLTPMLRAQLTNAPRLFVAVSSHTMIESPCLGKCMHSDSICCCRAAAQKVEAAAARASVARATAQGAATGAVQVRTPAPRSTDKRAPRSTDKRAPRSTDRRRSSPPCRRCTGSSSQSFRYSPPPDCTAPEAVAEIPLRCYAFHLRFS